MVSSRVFFSLSKREELKLVNRPISHIPLFIHTGVFIYGFIL